MSQGALAQGSTADACLTWLARRARSGHTVLDLDYRAALWPDVETARAAAQGAIALSTVVVGNREECEMAVGTGEPDAAADALLSAGVRLAIVKLGADGSLLATADGRWRIPPVPVPVVCGLGAGDAFGGALSHGLLLGWDVPRIGRFANASGAYVSARLTCADAMPSVADVDDDAGKHAHEPRTGPRPLPRPHRGPRLRARLPAHRARGALPPHRARTGRAAADPRGRPHRSRHAGGRRRPAGGGRPVHPAGSARACPGHPWGRRGARQRRPARGARVAGSPRRSTGHRHDEPRRHHRRELGARRSHDRLRRRSRGGERARRRQDAAAHR